MSEEARQYESETAKTSNGDDSGLWVQWQSVIDIRTAELKLFWTRFSALLVVNGGALALFQFWHSGDGPAGDWPPIAVSVIGAIVSSLSVLILHGSYFWVRWWERKLVAIEHRLCAPNRNLEEVFGSHPHNVPGQKHLSTFKNALGVTYVVLIAWITLLIYSVENVFPS